MEKKIALLGKGKTGGKVLELITKTNLAHTVFDSKNIPTIENLKGHDVIISFLSGDVFEKYIPLLVESKIPVVCGSTGFEWPLDFNKELQAKGLKWIYASNFSLGMTLVKKMIQVLSHANKIYDHYRLTMNEIHHAGKLDAPSGTAKTWEKWIGSKVDISSYRVAEAIGIHELTLTTANEEISLRHNALDRKIFAEGALYAANRILTDHSIGSGLHFFQDTIELILDKGSL